MRIITNELKKIFNFTNLLIMGVATIMIWNLFIYFEIDVFPNGQPTTQHYNNAVRMLNMYGTSMDEEEFEDYKKIRNEKADEATKYLSSKEEYVKEGVATYDDFKAIAERESGVDPEAKNQKELDKIYDEVIFEDNIYLFWELDAIDYEIERYENKEEWVDLGTQGLNQKQLKRHKEVMDSEGVNSPLNFVIFYNYNKLITGINMLILISISIMVSPIFIKDNKNKINYIQYSTKEGRRLFNKKVIAGYIATTFIVIAQLGIFFIIYKSNNTYMFWDCSINSVFNDRISWFDITFGQYIILSVICTYLLAVAFSSITMFISSKVITYITLIGVQIPILFLINKLIIKPIEYKVLFTGISLSKYTLPVILLTFVLTMIIFRCASIKREIKLDINN